MIKHPRTRLLAWLLMVAVCLFSMALPTAATEFNPELAPISLQLNGESIVYRTSMRTLLPGETLNLRLAGAKATDYRILQGGQLLPLVVGEVKWKAPEKPGHYPFLIRRSSDGEAVRVEVFVLWPATQIKNERLNGYRIGSYPPPLRGQQAYRAPRGYIEVTPELESLQVSPHFRLGQFLCKQASSYPKYVVLGHSLLHKLELLLEDINRRGVRTNSLVVMSGYRTPYYNRAIGNVANSRHIYGGAADVFVDVNPRDNYMDDINGDGKTDVKDAVYLYEIADSLVKRHSVQVLAGGVGLYDKNAYRGPFVHVDVRGSYARWGH